MMSNRTAYRAANDDYAGPGACYAEAAPDARAYLDNPGFGGRKLYRVTLADDARVLDLGGDDHADWDWAALATILGEDADALRERIRAGYTPHIYAAWEEDYEARNAIEAAGYTHIRYADDYPEGAITITRIAAGSDRAEHIDDYREPAAECPGVGIGCDDPATVTGPDGIARCADCHEFMHGEE